MSPPGVHAATPTRPSTAKPWRASPSSPAVTPRACYLRSRRCENSSVEGLQTIRVEPMKRPLMCALLVLAVSMPLAAQYKDTEDTPKDAVIKRDETVKPDARYANMPDEAVPYGRFTKPYYDWFVREDTIQYHGAADQHPSGDPSQLQNIAIG